MTEWNADGYEAISQLQRAVSERHLEHISFGEGERVLDVGCGNGRLTAEIAARVPRGSVVGVDFSRNMIDFAGQQCATGPANLRFEVGDVRDLPYRGEFDTVVSFNVLHWVPEQEAALRSIFAALKPQGHAVLRFVPNGPRKCLEDVIEETCRRPRWTERFERHRKPYVHFAPEDYRALAERTGFQVLDLDVQDNAWDFGSREAFAAFCRVTFTDWLTHLPNAEWPEFIDNVLDAYAEVVAGVPAERNIFKFYQMEIALAPTTG